MQSIDEQALAAYLLRREKQLYSRLLTDRFFQAYITTVNGTVKPPQAQIRRLGEPQSDENWYPSPLGYYPQINDLVDVFWRDNTVGYIMGPIGKMSTGPWRLDEKVITQPTSTFMFPSSGGNLPSAIFRQFRIIAQRVGSDQGSNQDVRVSFDKDTTSGHYHWSEYFNNTSATAPTGASSITDGGIPIVKAVINTGHVGAGETTIFDPGQALQNILLRNKQAFDDGSNLWVVDVGGGWFPSPLSILHTMTFTIAAGNMISGVFTLWGDP